MPNQRHISLGVSVISIEDEAVGLHWLFPIGVVFELRVISLVQKEITIWHLQY
jgi:hypothetical protein